MQKEQPIEIGELIKQAKELNCSISLNFAQHVHSETVEADGVFIANFIPIDDEQHPIKTTWGYWTEGYRLSGGTTLRLFTLADELEQISDCEFAPLGWYEEEKLDLLITDDWLREKINDDEPEICEAGGLNGLTFPNRPIMPPLFDGCNGLTETDLDNLQLLIEGEDYTLELSKEDQQALEDIIVQLDSLQEYQVEHEKKNDSFDAYDRAKQDLEE